jgi:hypothetical protein
MREYAVLEETDSLAGLSHSLVKYVIDLLQPYFPRNESRNLHSRTRSGSSR